MSPAERPAPANPHSSTSIAAFTLPAYWNAQTLTELKIYLRTRRSGRTDIALWSDGTVDAPEEEESIVEGIGRNEGTVRFLWDKQEVQAA